MSPPSKLTESLAVDPAGLLALDADVQQVLLQGEDSPPVVVLARQLAELNHAWTLHYDGHVRLTRKLSGLDRLLERLEALQETAAAEAERSAGRWQLLLGVVQRRLEQWQQERGAIAQLQAAAHDRDRQAALLTSRARFVLHRYVRHFAGHGRRNRDLQRLSEMHADLQAFFEQLRPLATRGIHLRTVAEEIGAVGGFVQFFAAELAEIGAARQAGSLNDQSNTWGSVLQTLKEGWQSEVLSTERTLRRPALVQRYATAMDEALEGLMTIRHANLPDVHEQRLQEAATLAARWQDEATATAAAATEWTGEARRAALLARAQNLYVAWRSQTRLEPQPGDRSWLGPLCDQLDEVERQWTDAALQAASHDADLLASDDLAWIRDTLVAMERAFDAAALVGP